jgi:hypothetical protein
MEGHGYYNAHSELQARSAEEADGVLGRALAAVALPGGVLTVADFGSSQGRNSMRQTALVLDRIAARTGSDREVMVVHTDLPGSDFTSLFTLLETAPDSYLRGRRQAFASAIGRSFYERLLPGGSLSFGWSSFALHWMSSLPLRLPTHIWAIAATEQEDRALAAVSAADWRTFLRHRAEELLPGGQLVLIMGALDGSGASGLEPLMDMANNVLRGVVADGRLSADVYAAMTIPARPRRRDEFTAPFERGELPALALEELIIAATPNAAVLRWRETGDTATFAASITGFFIAAFGPSLFGNDEALRETFASRLADSVAERPADVARPIVTATLRIARR